MKIEESEQKKKKNWSLLDPMVDLFEQIEEGVHFSEVANTPIPGGKVVTVAYLLIFITGGMTKACNSGKTFRLDLKTGRFQGPFLTILQVLSDTQ